MPGTERHALSANKWVSIKYVAGGQGRIWGGAGGQAQSNERSLIQREIPEHSDITVCLLWRTHALCCPKHKGMEEVKMLAGTEKERLKWCDRGRCRCPP